MQLIVNTENINDLSGIFGNNDENVEYFCQHDVGKTDDLKYANKYHNLINIIRKGVPRCCQW